MTLYVSVHRPTIIQNNKNKINDPPYEIRKAKNDLNPIRVHEAEFSGTVRLVYNPKSPLICGAICWLEVDE